MPVAMITTPYGHHHLRHAGDHRLRIDHSHRYQRVGWCSSRMQLSSTSCSYPPLAFLLTMECKVRLDGLIRRTQDLDLYSDSSSNDGQSHHKLLLLWDAAAIIGYLESRVVSLLPLRFSGLSYPGMNVTCPPESGEFTTGSSASSATYRLAVTAMLTCVAPSAASVPPRYRVTIGCGIVQTKTEVTVIGPLKGKYNQCDKQRDQDPGNDGLVDEIWHLNSRASRS
ncbi:hypothetical protein EDC04DRAFT_1538752 [Pisolithus marmoratus]|nr:hypothetical protein EDC04DRAFT_1538752 [Pisolithus marmoratus]